VRANIFPVILDGKGGMGEAGDAGIHPGWHVWDIHSCHGEWATFSVGLGLIITFRMLLFARFVISRLEYDKV
jgi:hypothetical protein